MAKTPIEFTIEDEDIYENVFDSDGANILAMRNVSWNGNEPKLELRKWIVKGDDEDDVPLKGFSFLTEFGPHNLTEMLVRNGYGDWETLRRYLYEREDSLV